MRLINSVCDEGYDSATEAEEDLYCWVLGPFGLIFDQIEPAFTDEGRCTVQDFLYPETYRLSLYVKNETLQPCLNYEVPREPRHNGVDLTDFSLCSTWRVFRPAEIELVVSEPKEIFSIHPQKVFAGETPCFFRPLDHGDQRAAGCEMDIYKRIETLGLDRRVKVPRMYGVVQDNLDGRIIGLLISWIGCGNKTLACALGPETSWTLCAKWDQL